MLPPIAAHGSTATGIVRPEGCELTDGGRLELQEIDGRKLSPPVVLIVPQAAGLYVLAGDDWLEAPGKACTAPDPCRPVARAKIRITHVLTRFSIRHWGREVDGFSGDFSIELQDGNKLEGSFQAKLKKPATQMICE